MSELIQKVKEFSTAGKYPCIIDTMMEVDGHQLEQELKHHNFALYHTCLYEQCKQIIVMTVRAMDEAHYGNYPIIINNFKALTTERMVQLGNGAIEPIEEIEVEGDQPGETEKVPSLVELQEMMKSRKLMKDLAYTIRDIRKLGVEVEILEGIDNTTLLDIYRISGTCNN